MHIAYITNQFPPHITAGLGRYVEAIAPRLIGLGAQLSVCSLNPGNLPREVNSPGVTVYRPTSYLQRALLGTRPLNRTRRRDFVRLTLNALVSNLAHAARIARIHRTDPIDLIVVQDTTNAIAALISQILISRPIILHVHTIEYTMETDGTAHDRTGLFSLLERLLAWRCETIIVASEEVGSRLAQQGWPKEPIAVIELANTFDELTTPSEPQDAIRHDVRAHLGVPDKAPLIVFAGRIERAKGVYELTEAFNSLAHEHPNLHIAIVGEGDTKGVSNLLDPNVARQRTHLLPSFLSLSELRRIYIAADVCVFPSKFEPFGLVALEAMSLGRPVVLGSGFGRALRGDPDDPPAMISDVSPSALAQSLDTLLTSPELRDKMAAAARRHASQFTWERTAAKTFSFYSAACAQPNHSYHS